MSSIYFSFNSEQEILWLFLQKPVSDELIQLLEISVNSIIKNEFQDPVYFLDGIELHLKNTNDIISLNNFMKKVIKNSKVLTYTLISTLVYHNRLKNKFRFKLYDLKIVKHVFFLANLILSYKFINDNPLPNKYWCEFSNNLLSVSEINTAERELLFLLNWDISVNEDELILILRPILFLLKQNYNFKMNQFLMNKSCFFNGYPPNKKIFITSCHIRDNNFYGYKSKKNNKRSSNLMTNE